MRTQKRNRQTMWYALPSGKTPVYEMDDDGNIKYYEDDDGNLYPIETGEYEAAFGMPTSFKGAFFSQLENAIVRAWGNDNSNNYAVLVVGKNAVPELVNGARIWRKKPVEYKPDGSPDGSTAEYLVNGVLDEELNEDSYYLQKL